MGIQYFMFVTGTESDGLCFDGGTLLSGFKKWDFTWGGFYPLTFMFQVKEVDDGTNKVLLDRAT